MYLTVGMKTRINSYTTGGLNKYDKLTNTPFHLILSVLLFLNYSCAFQFLNVQKNRFYFKIQNIFIYLETSTQISILSTFYILKLYVNKIIWILIILLCFYDWFLFNIVYTYVINNLTFKYGYIIGNSLHIFEWQLILKKTELAISTKSECKILTE